MRTIRKSYRRRKTVRRKTRGGMFEKFGRMSFSNWTGKKKPASEPISPKKDLDKMTPEERKKYIDSQLYKY